VIFGRSVRDAFQRYVEFVVFEELCTQVNRRAGKLMHKYFRDEVICSYKCSAVAMFFFTHPRFSIISRNSGHQAFIVRRAASASTLVVSMALDDYKVVLYRNQPSGWVAEVPSISGCYALMPTKVEALAELEQVFAMIEAEYRDKDRPLPADTTEVVHA
jgi:predicted RNase H-like HicB family nuclease